mgnify:CR=1 FL=1
METAALAKKLVAGIKKFFTEQGKSKAVLGLSGGIDSALVLKLLCESLGAGNVTALLMPNTRLTKQSSIEDARALAQSLGVAHFVVPIDGILERFEALPWSQSDVAKANLNARARALVLYNYANTHDCIVVGTGNKSEFYMGYFTKYGDGAADFFPIGGILKKEVRALSKHFGLPQEFLDKAPSAELWEGQEDEKELGITYEVLDEVLPLVLKKKKVPKGMEKVAKKISEKIKATEHKRALAKILEV